MSFWLSGILLLLSLGAIVLLYRRAQGRGQTLGIAVFTLLAAAMTVYLAMTVLLVNAVS